MKYKFSKTFIILISIILMIFIYYYGIERFLAIKHFDDYMNAQNVNAEYIESKVLLKDWKMGGYKMIVHYSNNKDYTYTYHYDLTTHKRNEERKYHVVNLEIVKGGRVLDAVYNSNIKYPPIN